MPISEDWGKKCEKMLCDTKVREEWEGMSALQWNRDSWQKQQVVKDPCQRKEQEGAVEGNH